MKLNQNWRNFVMNQCVNSEVVRLVADVRSELTTHILPFWMNRMVDHEKGGFYGQITGEGELNSNADKGGILNARILWTFAAAYRVLGTPAYLEMATRAKDYLLNHFVDKEYGGIYWSVDCNGKPLDTKKQIYALGFAIYGLSEYYRATDDEEALNTAIRLFHAIEQYSFDPVCGGYFEAFTREWGIIEDMRLSDKDANEKKTMNTHLHILEPYTNLYRVWKTPVLAEALRRLITIFLERILDRKTMHLNLFFDEQWNCKSHIVSYGHDIEASWLLHEAALVLGDAELLSKVEHVVKGIAEAAAEGLWYDGSLIYERDSITGHCDEERHWWPQAESVVGYFNLYQHWGDEDGLKHALKGWEYIRENLIDMEDGEGYWSRRACGHINLTDDKAGFWKCPYHNGRMCLELIERTR